jgi:hypothetical protein
VRRSKPDAKNSTPVRKLRCAVYTRKSSEEGLEQEFNSLQAQREACEAYVASQRPEGWVLVPDRYDDGGVSGGTLDRPALRRLLADIEAGLVDVVVVYKIDRLSRSLMDFARLVELFEAHQVTFVSVTQSFNTTTSMGPAHAERAVVLCPVRAGGDRGEDPGQVRASRARGHVDGGLGPARLRRRGKPQLVVNERRGGSGRRVLRALRARSARDEAGSGTPRGRRA